MFGAFTTKQLIRHASDERSPHQLEAVRRLGRGPMSEEIIACLAAVARRSRHSPSGLAIEAAQALAQSGDARVSTVLAELIDHESTPYLHTYLIETLSHPRHGPAIAPIIAAAQRELNATGHCHWLEKLLAAIGTPEAKSAWQDFRIASVDPILRAARAWLKSAMIPDWAEEKLAQIGTAHARRALDALRCELVWPLLHVAKTSDNFEAVGEAVAKLRGLKDLSVPGSAEALQEFLNRPARRLFQWIEHEEHAESGALERWTEKIEKSSSAFS